MIATRALTLAALLLVLSACGHDESSVPPRAEGPSTVHRPFSCPDPKASSPADHGADRLSAGATAALLCYRSTDAPWTAPNGPLTRGVDRLVDLVNVQRPVHDEACNAVGGPAWSLVLRYADGTRTIEGDNGGCGTMVVGGVERAGATRVFAEFLGALGEQRRRSAPLHQVVVHSVGCPSRLDTAALSVVAQPDRAATAAWCVRRGRHWVSVGDAGPGQLTALRHEFRPPIHGTDPRDGTGDCHGLPKSSYGMVVGRDLWGEPFQVDLFCDFYRIFPTGSPRAAFVEMSPAMRELATRNVTDPALRP